MPKDTSYQIVSRQDENDSDSYLFSFHNTNDEKSEQNYMVSNIYLTRLFLK